MIAAGDGDVGQMVVGYVVGAHISAGEHCGLVDGSHHAEGPDPHAFATGSLSVVQPVLAGCVGSLAGSIYDDVACLLGDDCHGPVPDQGASGAAAPGNTEKKDTSPNPSCRAISFSLVSSVPYTTIPSMSVGTRPASAMAARMAREPEPVDALGRASPKGGRTDSGDDRSVRDDTGHYSPLGSGPVVRSSDPPDGTAAMSMSPLTLRPAARSSYARWIWSNG